MGSNHARSAVAFRSGLIMTCRALIAMSAVLLTAPAQAMADSARFNIAAQPLPAALKQFAEQAHMQVLYKYDAVSGATGNAVSGKLNKREALEQLLRNSGLEAVYSSESATTIRVIRVKAASQAARRSEEPAQGSPPDNRSQEKSLWDRFLLAQVVEGKGPRASAVEGSVPNSQETTKKPVSLEEVVVTAQKRAERLQDVPISLSVLSGADLNKSTVEGITEALGSVPGVAAFPHLQGGGTVVAVRGVSASGPVFSGPSPIAYYLDGVPFGLVQSAFAPDANAYDMERVEILRGPQGTLYGASAQAGVVRVLTKDADLNKFELKARTSGSSTEYGGGNYRGDMAVNVPIVEGKLAARAVVGYEKFSGWINSEPLNAKHVNDAELRNYRLKVDARPTDALSIDLSAWRTDQDVGGPSGADDNRVAFISQREPISTVYDAYGVKIGYDFPGFSVKSTTSYLDYANNSVLDLGRFVNFSFPLTLLTRFDANVLSEEINLNSRRSGPWRWTAGAIYRDGKDVNYQELPVATPILAWTNTSRSYAMFGELSRRFFADQLEWTLGGRYFHDDVVSKEDPNAPLLNPPLLYHAEQSFNSTTPRAVLTWYPNHDLTVYGSYSEGFRSGTPQPYYVTGGVLGFAAVKPDKLHNYEIGAKGDLWSNRVSFDTALYYIDWKGIQQALIVPCGPCGGTPVTAIVNSNSASGIGVDFAVTAQPVESLELGVNLNWNDLRFDTDVLSGGQVLFSKGDRPSFSPKYTGGTSASYLFTLGQGFKGRFSASGNYTSVMGFRALSGPAVGNPMLIARTSLSLQAPNHWEAAIYADNVTNRQGAVFASALFANSAGLRVRPRTIGVQFDYHL